MMFQVTYCLAGKHIMTGLSKKKILLRKKTIFNTFNKVCICSIGKLIPYTCTVACFYRISIEGGILCQISNEMKTEMKFPGCRFVQHSFFLTSIYRHISKNRRYVAKILPIRRKTLYNQSIISKIPSKCGQGIHTHKPVTQIAAAWAGHSYTSNCQSMGNIVGTAFIKRRQCGTVNQQATMQAGHLYTSNCQSIGSSVGTAFMHIQLWFGINYLKSLVHMWLNGSKI